jgi:hypothetical protein
MLCAALPPKEGEENAVFDFGHCRTPWLACVLRLRKRDLHVSNPALKDT